ncbi:MAG: proton-conducting transporter membrane subunit, partial [Nitrospinota bacterium]
MLDYVWLIPAFPALGVLVNGLLGYRYVRDRAGYVGVAATGLSLLVTLALAAEVVFGGVRGRVTLWSWVAAGDFEAKVSFLVDPLSTVMLLVVAGVGFIIHVYSVGYMRGDPGYPRFFCYLNLFMVAMLVLVLADNYLLMFVGWEGVGLCSYLLIGYWYERKSASDAGNKAFIVNRIGDAGFLLGLFLMWTTFGTLEFAPVFSRAGEVAPALVTAVAVLLFVGAIGKSAQLPLYVWLPDAMEG